VRAAGASAPGAWASRRRSPRGVTPLLGQRGPYALGDIPGVGAIAVAELERVGVAG